MTIARTPLLPRRDGGNNTRFLIFRKNNICAWRTDNPNQVESAHEIRFCANAFLALFEAESRRECRRIDQTDSPDPGKSGWTKTEERQSNTIPDIAFGHPGLRLAAKLRVIGAFLPLYLRAANYSHQHRLHIALHDST